MKKIPFLLLVLFGSSIILCAQNQSSIKTTLEPDVYINFRYTINPFTSIVRLRDAVLGSQVPMYNIPSWGIFDVLYNPISPVSSIIGDIAFCVAYQQHQGDTISLLYAGNGFFPAQTIIAHQNIDGSLDMIKNMSSIIGSPNPGIQVKNGIVYYSKQVNQAVFFNGETRNVRAHNIESYNLNTGQIVTIFNWFDKVPTTMYNSEHWDVMWDGTDVDWTHFNWMSLDWDGNILVSWKNMGFCKINRNNGKVMWWGGLPEGLASSNGFKELLSASGDCRTRNNHNIKPFPNKPGWYTIFDNGDAFRPESRGLVFSVLDLNMFVEEEYESEPSLFFGSVDIWAGDTSFLLLNTCKLESDLGGLEFWTIPMYDDSLQVWDSEGVIFEKMEQRLKSGSVLRLINRHTRAVVGMWKTDSLNFVYDASLSNINSNINSNISVVNEEISKLNIYPNPTTDNVIIDFGSNYHRLDGYQLKIYNTLGLEVYSTNISQNSVVINMSKFSGNGMYLAFIIDKNGYISEIKKISIL